MSLFRFLLPVALVATATLAGCNVIDDDGSSSELSDPATQTCLRETVEECYAQNLPPDLCAALIEARCLDDGGMPPGDPGDPNEPPCDPPGPDPMCVERIYQECLAQGVDPMTCESYASQVCTNTDPPPGPDPMCVEAVREDCLAQGVDPMTCDAYANQVCDPAGGGTGGGGGGGQDPGMPDPNGNR
jgi:hypothetical protein